MYSVAAGALIQLRSMTELGHYFAAAVAACGDLCCLCAATGAFGVIASPALDAVLR